MLESRYIRSRSGVAISGSTRTARDGYLFENEVILSRLRMFSGEMPFGATLLTGCIALRPGDLSGLFRFNKAGVAKARDGVLLEWPVLLSRMRLGGDRNRSLGRVEKAGIDWNASFEEGLQPLETEDENSRCYRVSTDHPVSIFLAYGDTIPVKEGRMTVLAGRLHSDKGPGGTMSRGCPAWDCGWPVGEGIEIRFGNFRNAAHRGSLSGRSDA